MGKVFDTLIEEEMRSSYIDYAMSVIVGRALPDVRDGLKPVQRRILYAMRNLGLLPERPFRKSATVVGEVIGKYHPHGDMAVYEALVRLAQDFSMRYPLIEGQGNFGSIDGDPPAAYRYTEARLSKVAMSLLEDLEEETVDFVPNFDGRLKEPTVLPSSLPNLIVNGCSGIAVGMATNIPPHNLNEIVDALIYIIDHGEIGDDELFQIIKGPDFPTGGIIFGEKGIREAYLTGKGKMLLRAKYHVEEGKGGQKKVVITEIPYQVSKALIVERIAELVREKKIEGVSDLRDESDRKGLRIVIELRKGVNEQILINQLIKHTPIQVTYGMIFLALVDGEPKILSIKALLHHYLRHREEVVERRTKYRLKQAETRAHILKGFLRILPRIEEVVETIKTSKDPREAKEKLKEKFEVTDEQAKSILDMRLQSLTRLESEKIEREYRSLERKIKEFKSILRNREVLLSVIKKELIRVKEEFGDRRRTEIVKEEPESLHLEDLVPSEEVVVTLTHEGYIKRTPLRSYRQQARGGVGKSGISFYEEDFPIAVVTNNTHDLLLLLTNFGRAFCLKTYEVKEGGLSARGGPLKKLINLKPEERVTSMIPIKDFDGRFNLFMATKRGIVKKTPLSLFRNMTRRGIQAISLGEEDELVGALLTTGEDLVIIAKSDGTASTFHEKEVREMGRQAKGIKGTRVKHAEVVSLQKVEREKLIVIITSKGFGKVISPQDLKITRRGALGIKIQKVNEKTGKLVRIRNARGGDDVLILSKNGTIIRIRASQIKKLGKFAQGVRLMKLREGDEVVDMAIVEKEE